MADGQQVEIPVPRYDRTVGTRVESIGPEWKDRRKRGVGAAWWANPCSATRRDANRTTSRGSMRAMRQARYRSYRARTANRHR